MLQTSTLRPGLLVSLKTSVRGNVSYTRKDLERTHKTKDGKQQARWETERTVTDPEEFQAAQEVRKQCWVLIMRPCSNSAFGLLCPEDASDELETAIADARKLATEFNTKAKLTRIEVYVMTGRIAADDVEAVRAINGEVRDLLNDMETGLKNLDVKTIRDAANKARTIGNMLSPDAQARVQLAIDAARTSARQIVKAGEQASMEIDKRTIKKIAEQRIAFLDLDEVKEVVKPKAKVRAVDFAPAGFDPNLDAGGDAAMARAARSKR